MANKKELDFEESSGNIFADLGIPNAEQYLTKARLAHQINHIIKKRNLTQVEAAKLLEVDQPKISALACGRFAGFSIERLFRFLTILNQDIVIMVKPRSEKRKINAPHISVRYAGV